MKDTILSSDIRMAKMMEQPLLLSSIVTHAANAFPYQEIVARRLDGGLDRTTFVGFEARCRKTAAALRARLNVEPGECLATLAWNTLPHLDLYFAIPGIGAVCHTLNIRYSDDQLAFIANKAKNRIAFVDRDQLSRIELLGEQCPSLETVVVLDGDPAPTIGRLNVLSYSELLADIVGVDEWPVFDERAASSLCYSSGSTGDPKGALYSHRSTLLYCLTGLASGQTGIDPQACVLPAVPMFHVNGWCKAHQALIAGAKLVLPGAQMAGEKLADLIESEAVTVAFGVPTIWLSYLDHLKLHNGNPKSLKLIGFGGGTPTRGLLKRLHDAGLDHRCGFGMTETTTGLATGFDGPDFLGADPDAKLEIGRSHRPFYGVSVRARSESGQLVPHDGKTPGEMECHGHFVISGYFEDEAASSSAFTEDGWFKTGDVISIDQFGRFKVVDRLKDMVKSGGEWISSQTLESLASTHPAVAEAAVIGLPHPRWNERPLLILRLQSGESITLDEIKEHILLSAPKWWLPDAIKVVDSIPHATTGKIDKRALRIAYQGYEYDKKGNLSRINADGL